MSALRAFISGTLLDLVEQRRAIIDVCLELGIQPLTPETLAAGPAPTPDAIADPLKSADLLLVVVGFRYGFVPEGQDVSIVEMEYELAKSMAKPTVVFMMSDQHPISPRDLDIENAARMMRFRKRLQDERLVIPFSSVAELRARAVRTLQDALERMTHELEVGHGSPDESARTSGRRTERARPAELPSGTRVPFVTGAGQSAAEVVGRERELQRLDAWCNGPAAGDPAPTMVMVGHGGMGKTALAWRFFESAATQRFDRAGGRFWWSFYESPQVDAFHAALFTYITGKGAEENPRSFEPLLHHLRDREMLIVLDGVERLLVGESASGSGGLGLLARTSDYARRIVDGRFQQLAAALPALSGVRAILISRAIPADLESFAGAPRPGFELMQVGALAYDDVVDLLHRFGVPGSRDELAEMARKTAGVPLVARLLASQVMHTGKIAAELDTLTTESSIRGLIGDALQRLTALQSSILGQIASTGATVSQSQVTARAALAQVGAVELDQILTRLENLQLVEWNRKANTYNVHPLVRDAVMKSSG